MSRSRLSSWRTSPTTMRDGINASAHQLRHYAGTTWYAASGNDLLATARLLRHVNVSTTQVYAALSPVRPAEVVGSVALDFRG
jgi:integrase